MNKPEIFEKIKQVLVDKYDADGPTLTEQSTLGEDLGLDSLDQVEFIMEMERHFSMKIEDDDAAKLKNIGDILNYIDKNVNGDGTVSA